MIPPVIALACGFMFAPPVAWASVPFPPGATVVTVTERELFSYCPHDPRYTWQIGCADASTRTAFVVSYHDWHGSPTCYRAGVEHEEAHLKGYIHP